MLFDQHEINDGPASQDGKGGDKENTRVDTLKELEAQISKAIEKVKALKAEKAQLSERNLTFQKKINELENQLIEKDMLLERMGEDKNSLRGQLSELLQELESIELPLDA